MNESQATAKMARTPAPDQDQDARPLADTGSSGIERLRELEKLLNTARSVRKLAEAEIKQGKNLERARHRFDAANRMQRKVERELLRLRSELASDHPEVNQVWTPGDPVGRKPSAPRRQAGAQAAAPGQPRPAAGDFELAVMLGKDRTRWNQPGTTAFDLQQEQTLTRAAPGARRATPAGTKPKSKPTVRKTPADDNGPGAARREKGSRTGLILTVVITGILAGAAITFVLTSSSASMHLDGYWDRAVAWLPELPVGDAAPASSDTPDPMREPAVSAPAETMPASATGRIVRQAPSPGRIVEEERRLQQQARQRFETRLKQRHSPAAQTRGATLF